MSRVDFDQYARQYEDILAAQTNFFDGDSGYFARYKIELAQQLAGSVSSVLDFGCGIGRSMKMGRRTIADTSEPSTQPAVTDTRSRGFC